MSINLFISLYNEQNRERQNELHTCLMNNLKSGCFDRVWAIAEDDKQGLSYLREVNPYTLNVLPCTVRPTFRTFFEAINNVTKPEDINVIANSDIYFESIPIHPKYNECFALTRYEVNKNGPITFLNRRDSQDSFFFNGHIKIPKFCDFFMLPGADNRICWELMNAGYQMSNPSLTIKSFHLHDGQKSYDGSTRVNRPYYFIVPSE